MALNSFDEVSVEANTRDIRLAISSFLEGRTFSIHHENNDGGTLDPVADAAIEAIDASDPNNLVLMREKRTTLHRPHHRRRLMRSFWGLVAAVQSREPRRNAPDERGQEQSDKEELPAAVPSRKGRARRFAPLPTAPAAGSESGSSGRSGGSKGTSR